MTHANRRRFVQRPHSLPVQPFAIVPFSGITIGGGTDCTSWHVVDQRGNTYAEVPPYGGASRGKRYRVAEHVRRDLEREWA